MGKLRTCSVDGKKRASSSTPWIVSKIVHIRSIILIVVGVEKKNKIVFLTSSCPFLVEFPAA